MIVVGVHVYANVRGRRRGRLNVNAPYPVWLHNGTLQNGTLQNVCRYKTVSVSIITTSDVWPIAANHPASGRETSKGPGGTSLFTATVWGRSHLCMGHLRP